MITDSEIERLINIEKVIFDPPKKEMMSRQGSLRNDFKLESVDGKEKFHVFIRVSEQFNEDFSIGINHINKEGKSICILRCNGKHGEHRNHREGEEPFYDFHIHTATQEAVDAEETPEHFAEITSEYATWQEALLFFLKKINVKGAAEYFGSIWQQNLFN